MRYRLALDRSRTVMIARAALRIVMMLVIGVTLLAGCASVRFGSTFTETGTATHTLEITLPRASMTELDLARVERQIADAEMNARAGGLTTARIDNPETIGIRVINTTQDATDAGLALNSIFNTLVTNEETGPVAPFQGTFDRVSEAVGGNSFKLSMTVDGDLLYSAVAKYAPGHPQFSTPEGVRELVSIEYLVTMPGEVTDTNGGRRGEGGVLWTIPLQGPTELEARSTVGKDTPWVWTILAIIAALALVGFTATVILKLLLIRHRAGRTGRRITFDRPESDSAHAPPPDTLPEIRATLRELVRKALRGERLNQGRGRATQVPTVTKEPQHGVDAEGD